MELMEEGNPFEEEVVTTPTRETAEEMMGELRCEADAAPQEPASTSGLNAEDLFQFPIFIPRGARVTHSP